MASVMFVLHELFTAEPLPSEPYPLTHEVAILLFRMKGFVSNQGISELLSALGYTHNSTGHISQKLNQMGGALSNTLQIDAPKELFWLPDEIFANNRPILITIEPQSTAILRIELADDRKSDTWEAHFLHIEANQITPSGACSDRGKGIVAGFSALESQARLPSYSSRHSHLESKRK